MVTLNRWKMCFQELTAVNKLNIYQDPKFGCYYFPTKYWATEDEENFEVVKYVVN